MIIEKKVTKAEVLWARVCNLACSYCAMPTEQEATPKDWPRWSQGVEQLKKLQCGFAAIYGAEPLMDFQYLPEFVRALSEVEIPSTIITSCTLEGTKEKLEILYEHGLRSLSVSYDGSLDKDRFSVMKTGAGLPTLLWFRDKHPDLRDVACIMTATRQNFWQLPELIRQFSRTGIWMFFDFIHGDRGQPGTKCKSNKLTPQLQFQEADIPRMVEVFKELKSMKSSGYLVHTSHQLLDALIMNPYMLLEYQWHCRETGFPSWITIENTGEVYCCDDFHPRERLPIYVWEIYDRFEEFSRLWDTYVRMCPGCCWNTHYDSNRIKQGLISITDYVHGIKAAV